MIDITLIRNTNIRSPSGKISANIHYFESFNYYMNVMNFVNLREKRDTFKFMVLSKLCYFPHLFGKKHSEYRKNFELCDNST
jgi:hypothetical protein